MHTGLLFINTIETCAGIVVFSLLLYLFLTDWKRSEGSPSGVSGVAAALGLLWSASNFVALVPQLSQGVASYVLCPLSIGASSLLLAVLLQIGFQRQYRAFRMGGYLVTLPAFVLYIWGQLNHTPTAQEIASALIALGFSTVTVVSLCLNLLPTCLEWHGRHKAISMSLLLPPIFFAYYAISRAGLFQNIALPLSLLVLLLENRFLLPKSLLRFAFRGIFIVAGACWVLPAEYKSHFLERSQFHAALALFCLLVISTALLHLSCMSERLFTRLMVGRAAAERILSTLRDFSITDHTEEDYLDQGRRLIEVFFDCENRQSRDYLQVPQLVDLPGTVAVVEKWKWPVSHSDRWTEAALSLRFSAGDGRLILLGRRRGARPYLNGDLRLLALFGQIIEEQVECRRQLQTQTFATHAELMALQAQINPHFFFNSLNTLYGVISRDNVDARRLVLNLADVFHHLLRSDRTFVSLKQELAVIDAYLEIEKLRLGSRLTTSIQIDEYLLNAEVPVLSIQPLVENAVKHGVAQSSNTGVVRLTAKADNSRLKIEIANSGQFGSIPSSHGAGVGLDNVRRRLALCYGVNAELRICSKGDLIVVCCSMPLSILLSDAGDRAPMTRHFVRPQYGQAAS